MTLLVPFDGSELAEAALVRATEFGIVLDEAVLAVSVIPKGNTSYARERGWIRSDEEFTIKSVVSTLHKQVTDLCPSADFRHEIVDKYANSGRIALGLRKIAREEETSMVFIGSENAGRIVMSVSSVGGNVAADASYDVTIVRNRAPSKIAKLQETSSHKNVKSDFYLTEAE